ncbi:hypothetical protein [Paenibacillus tianmuensis]|uniref:hypothetical protein n=1 Tax=Paenibacillus tianmuensis TaxID=624147 RepID=UPI00115FF064|nr:hypothetical protein [Paenibacillus tianmuensis]
MGRRSHAFIEAGRCGEISGGYDPRDTIRVIGTSPLSDVIVKIVRPDGTVLYFNAVKVNQGAYEDTITLSADELPGDYTVIAGQGGPETSAKQTFSVTEEAGRQQRR